MDFSASAATKDAARNRRRRSWTPPRFSSTLPRKPDTSALLRAFARPRDPRLSAGKLGNALNLEVWTTALKDRGYSPTASAVIAYVHHHYLESALAEQVCKLEQPRKPAEAPNPPQQPESADEMIAMPEWLEEKATDAPTMMRVMNDVVERQLRRDHPNALLASEWAQFRQHAIVAGCSALALRLHKEIPEAYRTLLNSRCETDWNSHRQVARVFIAIACILYRSISSRCNARSVVALFVSSRRNVGCRRSS